MKPIYAALTAMAGVLALMNSPLSAQDAIPLEPKPENAPKAADALPPPAPEPAKPDQPDRDRGRPRERDSDRERDRDRPTRSPRVSDEVMTPYIGVLTSDVPRELRAHFNLTEGFGLLVQEVMPETPAKAAGLKVDDVLLRFEDQKLVNMEQLQTLVRSKKKGDVVPLTVISAGQEKQVSVTIDERLMPATRGPEGRRGEGFFQRFDSEHPFFGQREGFDDMKEMREAMENYQKHMRDYQERMRDWNRDGRKGERPPAPPSWRGPDRRLDDRSPRATAPREGDRPREDNARPQEPRPARREVSNVTRSDDSGIYSLRQEGDRTLFTAKPKDGEEKTWSLNNDEDRRAIPEHLKEKLRLLEEIRGEDAPRR